MNQIREEYFFHAPAGINTIWLPLRRTLVRLSRCAAMRDSVILFTKVKTGRHRAQRDARRFSVFLCAFMPLWFNSINAQNARKKIRTDISLNSNWRTIADDQSKSTFDGFEKNSFNDKNWITVDVPHNWDEYEGYRRMRHGNRHGYAWYRKAFTVKPQPGGKRYFLFFEGVGSYATVWLNGKQVGYHAGGRTSFTLDVTDVIKSNNQQNLLAVRADHPSTIRDLPWVCGGCSDERGFSEGSQPMGVFRPVHLIITDDVRVEPFGVHIWNDTTVSNKSARIFFMTELKNYSNSSKVIRIISRFIDKNGLTVAKVVSDKHSASGLVATVVSQSAIIKQPHLWSLSDPYLYNVITEISEGEKVVDRITTPYGIRWISWPIGKDSKQFFLNGKPVFINGVAEYEHLLGSSHAFGDEEIRSRVMQIKAAGFNAFRDAHQPHNLRYQNYWDSLGFLWWAQMSAHIWFDSPEFRNNFKTLLKEWVKERRNSPSLVLWGLQNESKLPEDFAKECSQLIRDLDPTASSQRLITTCNGGSGTDWDVPQNWTGTYGGDPTTYAQDIKKQILVGEYGAWRTLDLHSEDNSYESTVYSEERMAQLMETKIKLAEQAKDSIAGHFMWLFSSHDNPGRVQGGEGYRELDRVGPVNYKGLFTPWEQPLDVYYMYRSNYAPKDKQPMVYIVSHTWPNRWTTPGKKNNIVVYSNCDEVELFNDVRSQSLGKKKRLGIGTHFQWNDVDIRYNVLYAVGYVNGKEVAEDYIVLNHLPQSPHFNEFFKNAKNITKPQPGYNYLYRVNCGGADYKDENGNLWLADRALTTQDSRLTWGSISWTNDFKGMPPFLASQQRTFDLIKGTKDGKLFQTFRYGREKLKYYFPVQDGEYLIELYFTEPWLGAGGGMDCTGWRSFDVSVNDKTVLRNIDIWKAVGYDGALKKTIKEKISGGQLIISFPHVASGQAVISAIAIASLDRTMRPASSPEPILKITNASNKNWDVQDWLDLGDEQFSDEKTTISYLPPELFGAQWIKMLDTTPDEMPTIELTKDADVFVAIDTLTHQPQWLKDFVNTRSIIQNDKGNAYYVYKKRFQKGQRMKLVREGIRNNEQYLIMAQPATNIEPAYDLKPVAEYKAVDAKLRGLGIVKGQVDNKERIIFKNASADNVLEWNFSVGVADLYSLTISYNNPKTEIIKGNLQLLSDNGTLIKQEEIDFMPTREGKLNYINTTTGMMINAGNYKLRIVSKDADGLSISSLDVQ
jgi:beta-galactosidase